MKKANVNLFDKNKVQVKLLKNKALRISDGRKNPTKIVNLRKTGITIWTDGKHLKIFRGNLLKEVIGRSVYKANKFQTVEFVTLRNTAEKRSITTGTVGFIGVNNIQEGLTIGSTNTTNFIGVNNIQEGRSVGSAGTASFIGVNNIQEGRSIGSAGTTSFIGVNNIQEGRSANSEENILVIGAKDASEARNLDGTRAVHISLADKFVVVRHGKV